MDEKIFYSARKGISKDKSRLDLTGIIRIFGELYGYLSSQGYFQQILGFRCEDDFDSNDFNPGSLGSESMVAAHIALKLRKNHLYPVERAYVNYNEDDLFDVIEFLYTCVSKPTDASFSHAGCSHYHKFDQDAGREEFRSRINEFLQHYNGGYELSESGEILAPPEHGLESLIKDDSPKSSNIDVQLRIDSAINKFRRRNASLDDKGDAVRTLADIFELLRAQVKQILTRKDEGYLFDIANNFEIRHHNDQQKTDYDRAIWLDWMFYFYLSTLHMMLKQLERHKPISSEARY